jgi:hypothetical protein
MGCNEIVYNTCFQCCYNFQIVANKIYNVQNLRKRQCSGCIGCGNRNSRLLISSGSETLYESDSQLFVVVVVAVRLEPLLLTTTVFEGNWISVDIPNFAAESPAARCVVPHDRSTPAYSPTPLLGDNWDDEEKIHVYFHGTLTTVNDLHQSPSL